MQNGTERQRKSERLAPGELEALKKWADGQITLGDAQTALGVSPGTFRTLRLTGQASPATIQKVRAILTPAASA